MSALVPHLDFGLRASVRPGHSAGLLCWHTAGHSSAYAHFKGCGPAVVMLVRDWSMAFHARVPRRNVGRTWAPVPCSFAMYFLGQWEASILTDDIEKAKAVAFDVLLGRYPWCFLGTPDHSQRQNWC